MTLTLLLLAKAAAVAAPPPDFEWTRMYPVAPPPIFPSGSTQRPPVVVTPTTVELTGAGDLAVKVPPRVFVDLLNARGSARQYAALRMWFDASGKLLNCESRLGWGLDQVTPICAAAENARFTFAPGFAQPMERGFLNLWVSYERRVEPVQPLRLRSKDKGTEVRLIVNQAGKCRVTSGKMTAAVEDQICKVLNTHPRSLKARAAAEVSVSSWANAKVWLDLRPLPPEQSIAVAIDTPAERIGETILYPDHTATEPAMPLSYGTFSLPLTSADFPEAARRWNVYSASTVLAGIGSDGKAVSCRPVASSGAPLLDNRACALAVQKGSFAFTAGVPTTPIRYVTHKVDWRALAPARP